MNWGTDTRYVSVNLIITISCDLLSIKSEGPYCNEILFETQMFSFNKNALENVICQTTAISTRPYCVKLTPPLSYHQYVEVVNVSYFREGCEGGPKNQSFWKTIKTFILDNSSFNTNNIILQEGDTIINDTGEILNDYFTSVASNIDFGDTIPTDFDTGDG